MKNLLYLNERKQAGVLYHFTDIDALDKILNENVLRSKYPYISFTRNSLFVTDDTYFNVRIVFDGEKLSDKYKIEPFDYSQGRLRGFESEERIIIHKNYKGSLTRDFMSKINDIKKYIIRIDIINSNKNLIYKNSKRFNEQSNKVQQIIDNNKDVEIRLIKNFKKFENSIFTYEEFLNEMYNSIRFKLILSEEFKDIVSKIESPISDKILNFTGELDISYVDTSPIPEMISYFRLSNYKKNLLKLDDVMKVNNDLWHSKFREQMKIGKFVNRILMETKSSIGPVEIGKFVNEYKGITSSIKVGFQNFDMLYGENMRKFYDEKNYMLGGGFLNSSCMRHDYCQEYLNMYVENPDKVNLLIMRNSKIKNKIDGRALIWNLDSHKGKKLMDLPYCTKNYMMKIYHEYAIKKGWYYTKVEDGKENNYRFLNIYDSNSKLCNDTFEVNLTPQEYEYYPHLDIMRYYNPYTGNLTNDKNVIKDDEDYILLDQDKGGFTKSSELLNENKSNEEFSKWFDGSKIVKGGKPLLVYHFNCKDSIDPYNKDRIYFTDDPTFGERYLGKVSSRQHNAYLKIINPFVCTDKNLLKLYKSYDNPKKLVDDFNLSDRYERDKVFYWIIKLGHDGVIIPYDWDGGMGTIKSFVVFDKNQIWEL